jgi:hypothetical protein
MARSPKLKLFRTAIGFHDAYVAAPSRAAALRAWASDKDLFARGAAEEVDASLVPEAMADPGTVVKRSRGTAAEQVAALPPDRPRTARRQPADDPSPTPTAPPKAKPKSPRTPARPRPSRAALEAAEQALATAREGHGREQAALRAEEQALARRRRQLAREQGEEEARLERARVAADRAYREKLEAWHRAAD